MKRPGVVAALLLLAGCAASPPPVATLPPDDPPPPAPVAAVPDPRIAFQRRWLAQAEQDEQQGRLAEALWAREALALAASDEPARAAQRAHLVRLRGLVAARSQEAWSLGRDAQRRGDLDRAQRAYLQLLALEPEHAASAEALRGIERERNERQWLGRFSKSIIHRLSSVSERPGERIASEHATLLATQGEVDGAIQVLTRAVEAPEADPALRRQLADLHVKRAQSLPAERRGDAVAALRQALRLVPRHEGARLLLNRLTPGPLPATRKGIAPLPAS